MFNSSEGLSGAGGSYRSPISLWCCSHKKDILITIVALAAIGAVAVGILTLLASSHPDFLSGLNALGTPGGASFIAIGGIGLISVFLSACLCKGEGSPSQATIKHSVIPIEKKSQPKPANQKDNPETTNTVKKSHKEDRLPETPANTSPDPITPVKELDRLNPNNVTANTDLPAAPDENEAKPLDIKENDEKTLRKEILQPVDLQREKASAGTVGRPSTPNEDDKKIEQNQIKVEQTRQAFLRSLEKNYQECNSQLQKVSDFLREKSSNYSTENLPTTYDDLVALHQKIFKNFGALLRLEGDLDLCFEGFLNSETTFTKLWHGISDYSDIEKKEIFKDKNNEKYVLLEKEVNEKLKQAKELLGFFKELSKITEDLAKVVSQLEAQKNALTWMLSLYDQEQSTLQTGYSAFTQNMNTLTSYLETNVRQGTFDQAQLRTLLINAEQTAFGVLCLWMELIHFRRAISTFESSVKVLPMPIEANIERDLQEFQSTWRETVKNLDINRLRGLSGYSSLKCTNLIQ